MTAVPGLDAATITLICDGCGTSETTAETTADPEVVWPLVAAAGWSGSPFATGAHHCPHCDTTPPRPAPTRKDTTDHPAAPYALQWHDDLDTIVVAALTDIDAEATGSLKQTLDHAVANHRHVVIDLHAAAVIDSAGLGMLVRARQGARQHGSTLALVAPSRYVLTVLHTMRLDGVFDAFDDTQTALEAIRQG